MKHFEQTLRTFLVLLVTVLTLQHAQYIPISHIIFMYICCTVITVGLVFLFKFLGILEKEHEPRL